jgi:hypothetical protein
MSEHADPHAGEATAGPHGTADDDGATHGHDDQAHTTEALGPFDLRAWGAAGLGIVLGLVVMLAFIRAGS